MDTNLNPNDAKTLLDVVQRVSTTETLSKPVIVESAVKTIEKPTTKIITIPPKVNGLVKITKPITKPAIVTVAKPKATVVVKKPAASKAVVDPNKPKVVRKRTPNPSPRPRAASTAGRSKPFPAATGTATINLPQVTSTVNVQKKPVETVTYYSVIPSNVGSSSGTPSVPRGNRVLLPKPPSGTPAAASVGSVSGNTGQQVAGTQPAGNVQGNVFAAPQMLSGTMLLNGQPINLQNFRFVSAPTLTSEKQDAAVQLINTSGATNQNAQRPFLLNAGLMNTYALVPTQFGAAQQGFNQLRPVQFVQNAAGQTLQVVQSAGGQVVSSSTGPTASASQTGAGQQQIQLVQNPGPQSIQLVHQASAQPPQMQTVTENAHNPAGPTIQQLMQNAAVQTSQVSQNPTVLPAQQNTVSEIPAAQPTTFASQQGGFQNFFNAFNGAPLDLASILASLQQQMSAPAPTNQEPQFVQPPVEEKSKPESEFNLDDFITFPSTTEPNNALDQSAKSILAELIGETIFQTQSAKSVPNGPSSGPPPASVSAVPDTVPLKKKRAPRKKKEIPPDPVKLKVQEILEKCGEEMKKEQAIKQPAPAPPAVPAAAIPQPVPTLPVLSSLPSAALMKSMSSSVPVKPVSTPVPVLPSAPVASRISVPQTKPVVVPPPPVIIPPSQPPPRPVKKKTDLAQRDEKDVKMLEKLDLKLPFKGMTSSMNRLLPFHLLSVPDPPAEVIERENRAYQLVAESLVQRQNDLYARFMRQAVRDAAQPVSSLEALTCSQTWLTSEREALEAEIQAAAKGIPVDPPPWVFSDFRLEPDVPFFDDNYIDLFAEPSVVPPDVLPSLVPEQDPAIKQEPVSDESASSRSSAHSQVLSPESRQIKLKINLKRKFNSVLEQPASQPMEPPKKIISRFKISASKKWVTVPNAPKPEMVPEKLLPILPVLPDGLGKRTDDNATQNAVDSILTDQPQLLTPKMDDLRSNVLRAGHGSLMRQPVVGHGSAFSDAYFYNANGFGEAEPEDPALNEAIQSIL